MVELEGQVGGLGLRIHQVWERQELREIDLLRELATCGLTARVAHVLARYAADGEHNWANQLIGDVLRPEQSKLELLPIVGGGHALAFWTRHSSPTA